jgi:hypothetical protein
MNEKRRNIFGPTHGFAFLLVLTLAQVILGLFQLFK